MRCKCGTACRIVGDRSGDTAAGSLVYFVESTHVDGLAAIRFDLFHQIAVAIIQETRRFQDSAARAGSTHLLHLRTADLYSVVWTDVFSWGTPVHDSSV